MPANSRWDLIRRLRVKAAVPVAATGLCCIIWWGNRSQYSRFSSVRHSVWEEGYLCLSGFKPGHTQTRNSSGFRCSVISRKTPILLFNVHGSVHRNNILVYNSNYMQRYTVFYLTTALHVSGVTITHLQEHKITVTTASGNRCTVLLSAAIMEELEPVWVCCGTPHTTHSNRFQLFHDSSRQQYGVTVTRCCSYSYLVLLKMGDSDARNM